MPFSPPLFHLTWYSVKRQENSRKSETITLGMVSIEAVEKHQIEFAESEENILILWGARAFCLLPHV